MKTLLTLLFAWATIAYGQDSVVSTVWDGAKLHTVYNPTGPWRIAILEIDLTNPALALEAIPANGGFRRGFETTSSMARRASAFGSLAIGAVNGDYFSLEEPDNPYSTLGNQMIAGGEWIAGHKTERSLFAVTEAGDVVFDVLQFRGFLARGGDTLAIDALNEKRGEDRTVLYNKYIGVSTRAAGGAEAALVPIDLPKVNRPTRCVVEEIDRDGDARIGDRWILSASGDRADDLLDLCAVGDTVVALLGTSPDVGAITQAVGAGPRLVANGEPAAPLSEAEGLPAGHTDKRHPRTAVGVDRDTTTLFLLVVDGRQEGWSAGMTLVELADYMIGMGCFHAANFDGGGSTALVVRDSLVNRPSDKTGERPVANALAVVAELPNLDVVERLDVSPDSIEIYEDQFQRIDVRAVDRFGYRINPRALGVASQVFGPAYLDERFRLVPTGAGAGIVILGAPTFIESTRFVVKPRAGGGDE